MASVLASLDDKQQQAETSGGNKRYSISSDDDSSHYDADEDEKFYDAFDDTVQLLNSLNIGINTNTSDDNSLMSTTSSPSSVSPNNNDNDFNENNNNKKNLENDCEDDLDCNDGIKNNNENDNDDAELETSWTFWFDRCIRGTSYTDYAANLKHIYTVNTVKSFWSVFNNIPDVSNLPNRCSYHLMRGSRRPIWEDEGNAQGGQWNFKCNKEDTSTVWREALLAAIGEQFSDCVAPGDEIVGISASCRDKDDIIQIWNLNSELEPKATIMKKLEELVPSVNFTVKFYKPNKSHDAYKNTTAKKSYQKS